jgi:hypothetical protein
MFCSRGDGQGPQGSQAITQALAVLGSWALILGLAGCANAVNPGLDSGVPCWEPDDCAEGFECVVVGNGRYCQPRTDGGVPDADLPDAAPPDADLPDADLPDAAPPDAAPPDAAVLAPALTLNATTLDFAAPLPGAEVHRSLVVGNTGTGDLLVTSLQLLEDDLDEELFLVDPPPLPLVIPPGDHATLVVGLLTTDAEADRGYLVLGSNDVNRAAVLVNLVSENQGTPALEICVNEPPAPLTSCVDPTVFGYGLVPYGDTAVRLGRLSNSNPKNASLLVEAVEVPLPPAVPAPLFALDLFTVEPDPVNPGTWLEHPAELPYLLAPQQATPDLYLRVTFTADVDRYLDYMFVSVVTSGASDLVYDVPIIWQVSGCPEGYLDLSPAIPGCEYACPVWPGEAEQCNDLDDDCDGQIDEDFDKSSDPQHCGYCGHACVLPHATSTCSNSLCVISACDSGPTSGWANANGDPSDGCEYACPVWPAVAEACNHLDDDCDGQVDEDFNLGSDPRNCGSCGNDCFAQGLVCVSGQCALTCPPGTTNCDGGCVTLSNDPAHCGQCNRVCSYAHAQASCVSSTCMMGPCATGWRDLDGAEATGCEYQCPVWPTATEICDGVDNDCDGQIDEGVKTTFYRDADGDGHGNPMLTVPACTAPAGYVSTGLDCDDQVAAVYPSAPELCDALDNNCNGVVDEGVRSVFYRDADGDGHGNASQSVQACTAPAGHVTQAGDCNDGNAAIHPGAAEVCDGLDNDCNGVVDEWVVTSYYRDADGDGYGNTSLSVQACAAPAGYVAQAGDCNDGSAAQRPGALEVCDGLDNDCNGQIDEGVKVTYYQDLDGDGFGNAAVTAQACAAPAGHVAQAGDCADTDAARHPGVAELCDGVDNDCNGAVDEFVQTTFYRDQDGDGYGDATVTTQACTAPVGYVAQAGDCADTSAARHPGAAELCDGLDNDCNGQIDEGVKTTFYRDADGDGHGDAALTTQACAAPVGYVALPGDCNDGSATQHPGAAEVCDGLDNDCNGQVDEGVKTTFYRDADGDGYGDPALTTQACSAPVGYVAQPGDCLDTDADRRPGATEVCDGVDNNCNGVVDEFVLTTFYRDQDGDGYGNATITTQACSAPVGYVAQAGDCDDANAARHPGAAELCDGLDNDCNGQVDEGVKTTYYRDADSDGYGDATVTTQACAAPAGYVAQAGDCNDGSFAIKPSATEVCDGVDNNCNGATDEFVLITYYRDADGDGFGNATVTTQACAAPAGYVAQAGDCNDGSFAIKPSATEVCDGVDNNCNGATDEFVLVTYYRDADGDGYGTAATTTQACTAPVGYVAQPGDCNDGSFAIKPSATEVCDTVDNNCNGLVDELFDQQNDPLNCGACGNDCTTQFPHAVGICVAGVCQISSCTAGWRDDPAVAGDDCAYQCPVWPAQTETCNGKDDDCDAQVDESFDLVNDPDNCGACNNQCDLLYPNAQVECVSAGCRMVGCNTGYYDLLPLQPGCEYHCPTNPPEVEVCNGKDDDCDSLIDEGFDLQNDPLNCGACGVVVGSNQICCGGVPTDSDEANCGYCGRTCAGGVSCFGGSCIEPGIVVFSELMIDPLAVGDTQGEWLEIYNPTAYDINLRGWVLGDLGSDSHIIADDVIVPSLGYTVLGINISYSSNGGIVVDYQYSSFSLGNSGDEVVLTANGTEVDRVVFPGTFDVIGKSKELSRNHLDDVLNNTLTNWCTATHQLPSTDYGTPGWQNDCAL